MSKWFDADKEGLRQIGERLIERRGFGIIGAELYQNVMDTAATRCTITLTKTDTRGRYELVCDDDDPTGYVDLKHAFTVFAPSLKKADPEKAGRFNIGEKFVLAFCSEASVETTTGTVIFNGDGRHAYARRKRDRGTRFRGLIACNEKRLAQFTEYMQGVLVKPGLMLSVNGVDIEPRKPFHVFEETLSTEKADERGDLKPTRRKCKVEVYEVQEGETAKLFELGIPVVDTGDRWHYSVQQKVPLNVDRDNVTAAYLRDLRVFVFNELHMWVTPGDTTTAWVADATSNPKTSPDAIAEFKRKKYGDDAVAEDRFNPDSIGAAVADGRTVIPSNGLTLGQRNNLKRHGLLISSTQAYPTAGKGAYSDDPDTAPIEAIPEEKWTVGMREVLEYTRGLAYKLIGRDLLIRFVNWPRREGGTWRACYGSGHLLGQPMFDFNVGVLGRRWFANGVTEDTDSLILHELGHEFCTNHADEDYYRALTKLGAKLTAAVLTDPQWFHRYTHRNACASAGTSCAVNEGTPVGAELLNALETK